MMNLGGSLTRQVSISVDRIIASPLSYPESLLYIAWLKLIFEVGGDIPKNSRGFKLYQSSWGFTSKYEGTIPDPWPKMTAVNERL